MVKDSDHTLSLEFMRGHPYQAAQVLESLTNEDAAELFNHAPARVAAVVLSNMLPYRAANCLALLTDERALELLAPMGTQPTVTVLRYVPESRRRLLIAGLPTAISVASSMLLGYAEDTVGAWVDPDVVMLSADTHVEHALDRMRKGDSDEYPLMFVVDSERHLVGLVNIGVLLKASAGTLLGTIMQRPSHILMAHAPLAATPAHPGWEGCSMLPVVERNGRLVGMMTRDALTRALRRSVPTYKDEEENVSLSQLFARGYWHTLSGLLESGLTLLPKVSPIMERKDEQ